MFCYNVQAQVFPDEREIKITFVDISLDSALLLLSSSSNINISWDSNILPKDKQVSLAANYLKLGLALNSVFTGTDLTYRIVGNQLVVVKKTVPAYKPVITLSGRVEDENGEFVVYAAVFTDDYAYNTLTNEYGFYSLALPAEERYTLNYSHLGFERRTVNFSISQDSVINTTLRANNLLNEVVIVSEVPKKPKLTEEYDDIPINLLSSMASLGGEPDIIRMTQMRAGVTPQADGFGGLQVRGGSVDQNLILLDGVPLYNTGHALGLFSVFNPSAIKSAKLIKGGIPARYGGRLSSVLDVRVKEGSNEEFHGDLALSPLIVRGMLEGPISKGNSSFLISGRRTIVDPWLRPLSKYQFERTDQDGEINFYFYDLNAKANFKLGDKDQLFISGYSGKDRYANHVEGTIELQNDRIQELDQEDILWGNQIATVRWTHEYSGKMFGTASASYTDFNFENFDFSRSITNPESPNPARSYDSRLFISNIEDRIYSYDLDWFVSNAWYLKTGVNYTTHELTPGSDYSNTTEQLLDSTGILTKDQIKEITDFETIRGSELRGYIENEIRIGNKLAFNLGGHYSSISTDSETYTSVQPRLSGRLNIGTSTNIKIGYTQMDQYFHLLSSSGLGLPSDVWLPSTDRLPPERSTQFSASISTSLKNGLGFTIGAYDKKYESVTGFVTGGPFDIREGLNWQERIPVGEGTSQGIEFELSQSKGPVKGWLSYTYANSDRTFMILNDGETFRANSDRTHMFNVNLLGSLSDNIEITAAWVYGSPAPITSPVSFLPVPVGDDVFFLPVYDGVNNLELPAYHRLDIGVNVYSELSWGRQKLSFGAYNAYGRNNPFYVDVVQRTDGLGLDREQVSLIPFLPYVSVGLSF